MNRNMNLPQIQRIMMEFEKESELMDMKEEMMSDTIDEAMEEEEDEEEEETIVNQILDEIGINLNESVSCHAGIMAMETVAFDTWTQWTDKCAFFDSWFLHQEPLWHKQRVRMMPNCRRDWTTFVENSMLRYGHYIVIILVL